LGQRDELLVAVESAEPAAMERHPARDMVVDQSRGPGPANRCLRLERNLPPPDLNGCAAIIFAGFP
jgi:hypothetical protein